MSGALKYYPWQKNFYIGVNVGQHTISASTTEVFDLTDPLTGFSFGPTNVNIKGAISSLYVTPHIGWLWRSKIGIFFGVDLGYLSPLSPTSEVSESTDGNAMSATFFELVRATNEYQVAKKKALDEAQAMGEQGLPYATIRIGYLF